MKSRWLCFTSFPEIFLLILSSMSRSWHGWTFRFLPRYGTTYLCWLPMEQVLFHEHCLSIYYLISQTKPQSICLVWEITSKHFYRWIHMVRSRYMRWTLMFVFSITLIIFLCVKRLIYHPKLRGKLYSCVHFFVYVFFSGDDNCCDLCL